MPYYCWSLANQLSNQDDVWVFARNVERLPAKVRAIRFPFGFKSKRLEYGPNSLINRLVIAAHRSSQRFDVVHTQDGDLIGGDVVTAHAVLKTLFRVFRRTDPDHVAWLPKSPLLWAEELIYRTHRYRHVIVTSEKLRSVLRNDYGIREEDITVVRLGVDSERLRPDPRLRSELRANLAIDQEAPVLLHVSTDFRRKGLAALIRALQSLPHDYIVIVAGRGDEEEFRRLAERLEVKNRLIFLGYRRDLERIYPAADAFVFPTRFDFFGYPVLEAMACGVPPIVPSDTGVAELIRDGIDGCLLSNPENDGELADRIRLLIEDGIANRIGRAARTLAQKMTMRQMASETRNVYERVARA